MNANQRDIQPLDDYSNLNLDELEASLDADLENSLTDLELLKEDREKIGNPDSLSETVMNVVWEQFVNQVGAVAGEEFIRENRGLTLDLRNSAHIQTADNFKEGKIATHNHISRSKLEDNYQRYKEVPHGKFRDEFVDKGMNKTLPRAGKLYERGVETVTDIYTGRQIPTQTKLENGANNPKAAQREHVKSSSELYQRPSLQMANTSQELADIINDPNNLQGYTTAERNNRKSDASVNEMLDIDKNKHWEKCNERAEAFISNQEQKGEQRLKDEGRSTQRQETILMGKKALQGVAMGLLAALIKEIFQKFAVWLKSKQKSLSSLISKVKEAISNFVKDLKLHLKIAAQSAIGTLASMIFGPIVRTLQKAWTFIKQGYKSLKEAIAYIKNPANKKKPFSIMMMEVGKIIIAGLTAAGAIVLGGAIEGGLSTVPFFAFEIPMLGSLASIIGLFLGGLISGIIGAIALNLIDKWIAKKQKSIATGNIITKNTQILDLQHKKIHVSDIQLQKQKIKTAQTIINRHNEAADIVASNLKTIDDDLRSVYENNSQIISDESIDITPSVNRKAIDDLADEIDAL